MPRLVTELETLKVVSAWIDGEVIVQDKEGSPVFQPLQSAFSTGKTDQLIYFAFDLLFWNGEDLRNIPVELRREQLRELIETAALEHVRFSETLDVDPRHFLASGGHRRKKGRQSIRFGAQWQLDQDQVQQPSGICGGRLHPRSSGHRFTADRPA